MTITCERYHRSTTFVLADKADVFSQGLKDTNNTNRTYLNPVASSSKTLATWQKPDLDNPGTTIEFSTGQASDVHCRQIAVLLGKSDSVYFYYRKGFFVWQAQFDNLIQIVIVASLRVKILYLLHYHVLASHPRERSSYNTLHKELLLVHVVSAVFMIVQACQSCAAQSAPHCHQKKLWLLLLSGRLELIPMHILGPLPRTRSDNEFVVRVYQNIYEVSKGDCCHWAKKQLRVMHLHWPLVQHVWYTSASTDQ